MRDLADEALLDAWQTGDEGAFAVLFHRYRDRATAYAWRMVHRREEAEEICLEAFTRVVQGAWRPTGSFRSFLFTVVHRLCLDRLRRRTRAVKAESRLMLERQPTADSPEDVARSEEDRGRLERALDTLPEEHRSVLLLYYGQGLTSREVADILECTDQQVRSRLSYARRLLRQELDVKEEVSS